LGALAADSRVLAAALRAIAPKPPAKP
jgi:hypothetical protein